MTTFVADRNVNGWGVTDGSIRLYLNQFGRLCSMSYPHGERRLSFEDAKKCVDAAHEQCSDIRMGGRFGGRASEPRRQLCTVIAEALNELAE